MYIITEDDNVKKLKYCLKGRLFYYTNYDSYIHLEIMTITEKERKLDTLKQGSRMERRRKYLRRNNPDRKKTEIQSK